MSHRTARSKLSTLRQVCDLIPGRLRRVHALVKRDGKLVEMTFLTNNFD